MDGSERRQYERFNFVKDFIIQASSPRDKQKIDFHAKTINISRGGMLIHSIADFRENTKCQAVFISNRFKRIKRSGTVLRVVTNEQPAHLRKGERFYALEFEEPFTDEELQDILIV